jgi:hypothetical protein
VEDPETKEASAWSGLIWLLLAFGVSGGFYLGLPWLAKSIPWRYEKRAFGDMHLFGADEECRGSPESQAAFQKLVSRIYPIYPTDDRFSISATMIRGKEVNAFAFLGGRVFVYNGLVQEVDSPEELAGVLAHEIEHVSERHVTQGIIQGALVATLWSFAFPDAGSGAIPGLLRAAGRLKFGRDQEAAADAGGLARLRDSQVDVAGFRKFFSRKHGAEGWAALLTDHPSDESRLRAADAFLGLPSKPILTDAEWKNLRANCPNP